MIKKNILSLMFSCFVSLVTLAQSDTTGVTLQFQEAEELMNRKQYDSANMLLKSVVIRTKGVSSDQYFNSLDKLTTSYLNLGQYDSAEYYIDITLKQANADSIYGLQAKSHLSQLLYVQGNQKEAIEIMQEVEKKLKELDSDKAKLLLAEIEIGFAVIKRNEFKARESLPYYEKALVLRQEVYGSKSKQAANLLAQMAYVYMQLGEPDNAKTVIDQALDCFRAQNTTDVSINLQAAGIFTMNGEINLSLELAREGLLAYEQQQMNNDIIKGSFLDILIVNLTSLERAGEAKKYTKELLQLREKSFGKESLLYFGALLNLGNSYTVLQMYDSARYYLEEAVEIEKKVEVPDSWIGFLYYQFGKIHLDQREFEQGREYIRKAIAVSNIELKKFIANNELRHELRGYPFYLYELAKSYKESGDNLKGLEEIQNGLIACSNRFDSKDFRDNPPSSRYINQGMAVELLKEKAELLQLVAAQDQKSELRDLALECYKVADTMRIEYNKTIINQDDVFYLDQKWRPIYNNLIKLSPTTAEKYLYMEKSRAILFRRNSNEELARVKSDIPSEVLHFEDSIKKNIIRYKTEMLSGVDTIESAASASLFKSKRKLDSLFTNYKGQYPSYYQLKYSEEVASLSAVQEALDQSSVLIQFHVGSERIYIFSTSTEEAHVVDIPLDDSLKMAIMTSIDQLKNADSYEADVFGNNAKALYEKLLVETLQKYEGKNYNKLVILPDGILWNVNFELFLTDSPENYTHNDLPYLFRDYSIRYVYSQSVQNNRSSIKRPTKNLLAFSYGETDLENSGNQLSMSILRSTREELPGSRSEIKSIANLIDGDYYYGAFASEQQFKEVAGDYRVLHLAVHGTTDNSEPDNSRLDFFQKGDSIEDGQLHAFELYNMQLNADMAVLSACNTGSGNVVDGEGIMSLGRAFSYAGVNSLLLTRWEVSDTFTPKIMAVFYRELNAGKSKSEALRIAKLEFLANTDNLTSNPFYWGSFYILGDDTPVEFGNSFAYWPFIGGALLILLTLIIFFLNGRKLA
ncbi:MAG: CHAT domain-containing tetratricopeptide repeat protein [Bacteroidota bacterium]